MLAGFRVRTRPQPEGWGMRDGMDASAFRRGPRAHPTTVSRLPPPPLFALDPTGSLDIPALTWQLLAWNPTAAKYFRGAERRFDQEDLEANPIPSLEAEVRGAIVFLKVGKVTAGSLSLSVYAC